MKKYEVLAPVVVFNIKVGTDRKEHSHTRGQTVILPEDDPSVRAMLARKQIKEVAEVTEVPAKESIKAANK